MFAEFIVPLSYILVPVYQVSTDIVELSATPYPKVSVIDSIFCGKNIFQFTFIKQIKHRDSKIFSAKSAH